MDVTAQSRISVALFDLHVARLLSGEASHPARLVA
jgi:hypothetical protein